MAVFYIRASKDIFVKKKKALFPISSLLQEQTIQVQSSVDGSSMLVSRVCLWNVHTILFCYAYPCKHNT